VPLAEQWSSCACQWDLHPLGPVPTQRPDTQPCPPLVALLFDCDGVLCDTERDGHRVTFNAAFKAKGLSTVWEVEEYGELLKSARPLHIHPLRMVLTQLAASQLAAARSG
jgi:hypothetical protein